MRTIKSLLYTVCATVALSFAACDSIDEKDRYIEVEPIETSRAVLVEEFSGEKCVNCPEGAEILHGIQNSYGEDKVIIVTIHAGTYGVRPGANPQWYVGLVTDEGEQLCDQYGVTAFPSAVFDRRGRASQHKEGWLTLVSDAFKIPAYLDLETEATYSNETGMIDIKVTGTASNDIAGNLHVWITESGIIGGQELDKYHDSEGRNYDESYVHNHIFRAAVDGLNGTSVSYPFDGTPVENTFSIKCDEAWNADNLNVVVFVDNANGVAQAATAKVGEKVEQE